MNKAMVVLVWLEWPEKCFRINAEALSYLRELLPFSAKIVRVKSEKGFLKALPDATHVMTWHFKHEWYAIAKNLKFVTTPGAGRELVDRDAPCGVSVHFGGFHGEIIAESVVAYILASARGFFLKLSADSRKFWPRTWLSDKCCTVAGTRAVIAGYGKIGKAIGKKLEALGVQVQGFSRKNISGLPEAAKMADWFILALPSDTGTDDFLDAKILRRLPKKCSVINIGRGNSVDEVALSGALKSGKLRGAYLDVIKNEPPKDDSSPIFDQKLKNIVIMPHCSAFSPDYIKMYFKELKDDGII
jgi:phosphoglycerate dehydrogenase-like enzyme